VDRAIARQLSRFGAFVRQRSRSSIRKRKKVSDAGKPPTDRTGPLKLIYFAYDRDSETVTIGPILFPAKGKAGADLLEYGGLRRATGGSSSSPATRAGTRPGSSSPTASGRSNSTGRSFTGPGPL
jgi:hypothetical protein